MPIRMPVLGALVIAGLTACGSARPATTDAGRPPAAAARACDPAAVSGALTHPGGTPSGGLGSWPGTERDARHSGTAAAVGPHDGHRRWTRRLEGAVVPGPVIGADGTVFAASNGGVLHALDPATGRDRWRVDGGGAYGSDDSTSPLLLPGMLLWPGPQDSLVAVDPGTGAVLWRQHFDSRPLSPVRGGGRTLYVAEVSGFLHAYDLSPAGLRLRWSDDLLGGEGGSLGNPAVAPDGTLRQTRSNRVVAERDDGDHATLLWHVDIASGTEVSAAVSADGITVFGTNDDTEYGIDAAGKVIWRYPRNSLTYSSPAVSPAGIAYFGDHLGFVNAVDSHSGCLARRWQTGGEVWTAPAVDAAGDVYAGTKAGHVLGLAPDGSTLFDVDAGGIVAGYPALAADGTLLIGSTSGDLLAIGR